MVTHRIAHRAHDRTHELVFDHNPLTDRATLRVDGDVVPTTLVRKAFSGLFRYRFTLGEETLEVRVAPKSMSDYDVALARADEPLAAPKLRLSTIALGIGVLFGGSAFGLFVTGGGQAPPMPVLLIGLVAYVVTTGLIWLVYGRAR